MRNRIGVPPLALIALATLATLAMLALGAAAIEQHEDWSVINPQTRDGETIVVSGQLTVDLEGSLQLDGCLLLFSGGAPTDTRIDIRSGDLLLRNTKVLVPNGGLMVVSGRVELLGEVDFEHMDVLVEGMGTLEARNTQLTLRGSYANPSVNDPTRLHVEGAATFSGTSIELVHAALSSEGSIAFVGSSVEASADWGLEYDELRERLRFDDGTVRMVNSTFSQLFKGIHHQASLTAEGCHLNASDLTLFVPWWHTGIEARMDGCTLTSSDLELAVEESGSETKELDVRLLATTMVGGTLLMDLDESVAGTVLLEGVSMSMFEGYGIEIATMGFDGDLLMEDLDLQGPYGVQVKEDFSGLSMLNSTISAQETALEFRGTHALIPATLEGLTVSGETGLAAGYAALAVHRSDLSNTDVPLRALGGSALTLVDCKLDEEGIRLEVEPGQRLASVRVDRHLDFDPVEWSIGDAIDEGQVLLYKFHEDITDPLLQPWQIGDTEGPLVRIMEWTLDDRGGGSRIVFHHVEPKLVVEEHTFETRDVLDPWEEGPFPLVFKDDVNPWALLDGRVSTHITDPHLRLWGTCGDVGTGLASLEWTLHGPSGELIKGGQVDHLRDGRWSTEVEVTGTNQWVVLTPRDRTGNFDDITIQAVVVDVPAPLLTILRPESGMMTNRQSVEIAGMVDWYGDRVEIHVVGGNEVTRVDVENGRFSTVFHLPQEGHNQLIVRAVDPFDGSDEKWLSVTRDTTPPTLRFDGLDEAATNHVSNPSMVILGETDDPRAVITVDGQRLGLVDDRLFATTVFLREGPQTIQVAAMDGAGNVNTVGLRVDLDTIGPRMTLVRPTASPHWTNDDLVDVVMEVDEDLSSLTVNAMPEEVVSGRVDLTVELTRERTELVFRAVDLAGNVAERTVVLWLDTEPPIMRVVYPKQGTIVNTTAVQLVVVASEPGCRLSMGGRPLGADEMDSGRLAGVMYLSRGEGVRTINLTLADRAGNTDIEVLTLDVDTVGPFISLIGLAPDMRLTTEPMDVRGYTEPGSKVVWVNNRMATLGPDGEFSTTLQLQEGWQDITVKVVDRAGNFNETSVHVKALGAPEFEVPVEVLATGTIAVFLLALVATTELGRYSVLVLFLPLYTKLRKDKILDQRTRGLIQGYITANPGCNYTLLRDNLDLADGTLTYHLQVLEREGFVYSIREGLFRCFYPHGIPPPRRGKLHLSDTQADIVRVVKRIPGITVGEIATAMNRRPNVISYHLKLLREGGLLRVEEDGRHVRVYPIESAVAMI